MMSILNTLKDICDILFGLPTDVSNQGGSSQALDWLEKMEKQIKSDDPLSSKGDNNVEMLIPNLLRLVRECMSTHRWSQLVPIIQQLSKDDPNVFWKTSMEAMYTSESSLQLVQQLVKELKMVQHLNCQEILMEYLMFLLHQGKLEDAKQISQNVRKRKCRPTDRDKQIDILYKAYQSLVWYVEWAASKIKCQAMDTDNELISSYEEIMVMFSQKALIGFQDLTDEPGVWDIFITKHVEILEYYNRQEEARDILQRYRDKNMENLNAHKYLYQFSVRHGIHKEEELKLLMNIADASPSDSLVLQLCDKLIRDEKLPLAVNYLFTLLDYCCWQYELQPWKLLLDLIKRNKKRTDVKTALEENWKTRKSWWPKYHFDRTSNCPHIGEECDICYCKKRIVKYFADLG